MGEYMMSIREEKLTGRPGEENDWVGRIGVGVGRGGNSDERHWQWVTNNISSGI